MPALEFVSDTSARVSATVPTSDVSGTPLIGLAVSVRFQEAIIGRRWLERPTPDFDLSIQRADDGWIVSDRPSGVYGFGATLTAALADFREAAREHVDVLERQPALSSALQAQLDYLRSRRP